MLYATVVEKNFNINECSVLTIHVIVKI